MSFFTKFSRIGSVAFVGSVLLVNACAAPVDVAEAAPADGKTGASQSALSGGIPTQCKCDWLGYQISCDESLTEAGPNRCNTDCECAAGRKCNEGHYCEGIADAERCVCQPFGYQTRGCNEGFNKRGPNLCDSDCDCADGRTCDKAHGWCVGQAKGPTTCEEACRSDYDACRQGCNAAGSSGTKTFCLTTCATLSVQCDNRCPKP